MARQHDGDGFSCRPSVPPVFVFSLLFWAFCALSYTAARTVEGGRCLLAGVSLLVAALFLLGLFLRARSAARMVALSLLAATLGAAMAFSYGWSLHVEHGRFAERYGGCAIVELVSDGTRTDNGQRVFARLEGEDAHCLVTVNVKDETPLFRGDRLEVRGSARPANFDTSDFAWSRASIATIGASSFEQLDSNGPVQALQRVRKRAIEAIGGDDVEHAVLKAIVCGWRYGLTDSGQYGDFQSCGLAHMIAVSGAHLAIVVGLTASALQALGVRRRLRTAAVGLFMLAYLVVAGVPVSALRASVMAFLALGSYFGKRRASSLNALGLGIVLLVAIDPHESVSVSFALSCLSTAGIVLFCPLIAHWLSQTRLARVPFVVDALSLTLSASLASQPYAASVFGVLPIVSPLANVACTPLFPPLCALGLVSALAASAGLPGASALVSLASLIAGLLDAAVSIMARIPFASVPFAIGGVEALLFTFLAASVLWACWSRLKPNVVAWCVAVVLAGFAACTAIESQADEVVMLDVGQGDSFLVRSRGQTLLIDTGNQDTMLTKALGRHGVAHLDNVLITHADDDHCGSLDALKRCIDVSRVIVASDMLSCDDESCLDLVAQARVLAGDVVGVAKGDRFRVGAFECEVVWPAAFEEDGGNADSLVVVVRYDGDSDGMVDAIALFTGDAEYEQIAQVLADGQLGDVDILKVGHHGSRNALTSKEAHQISPRISLIGVGANNRYGHPHADTLAMLEEEGSAIYRSDLDGDVTCALHVGGIKVTTMQ